MEYDVFASILDLCDNKNPDLALSQHPNPRISKLKLAFSEASYKFLYDKSTLYLIILGNISTHGQQLSIKEIPSSLFNALNDLRSIRSQYSNHKLIGIGYSSGASALAALADIYKDIEAYCFNPIGLGKTAAGTDFYEKYSISNDQPSVTVIRTDSDFLSKNFIPPGNNKPITVKKNPSCHSHSIKNFIKNYQFAVSGIQSIFPTISQISFNPTTGFMLVEAGEDVSNYYIEGDIATIFYMVYAHPDEFFFTLVPADKFNPSGPYQEKIYGPKELENTMIGNYL